MSKLLVKGFNASVTWLRSTELAKQTGSFSPIMTRLGTLKPVQVTTGLRNGFRMIHTRWWQTNWQFKRLTLMILPTSCSIREFKNSLKNMTWTQIHRLLTSGRSLGRLIGQTQSTLNRGYGLVTKCLAPGKQQRRPRNQLNCHLSWSQIISYQFLMPRTISVTTMREPNSIPLVTVNTLISTGQLV